MGTHGSCGVQCLLGLTVGCQAVAKFVDKLREFGVEAHPENYLRKPQSQTPSGPKLNIAIPTLWPSHARHHYRH